MKSASKRQRKKKPSFHKLLKTSNVKLENKVKNRQFKHQATAKKQRKEQRKLRQAISDVSHQTLKPLERYKKKPEDEEEFLETLPTDMMEEGDLEQIRAMAQKASFITRELSSCAPVHVKKRKSDQPVEKYEKIPRKMQQEEQTELIHLLPIKDKSGLIPQTMEKPGMRHHPEGHLYPQVDLSGSFCHTQCLFLFLVMQKVDDDEEEEEVKDEDESEREVAQSFLSLTPEEQLELRSQKLTEKKLCIAALGSAILAEPHSSIKKLKELRAMLMESDPCVAVTVRKLVMVSLLEIFKDIVPAYRIRPLTEAEKATKVKKETQQLREFEEGLVSQYKFYLENLEQTIKDWKQKKLKSSQAVSLASYRSLAEVAIRCMCEMLVALPHFNFHNNIVFVVVGLMTEPAKKLSDMCCEAVRKLLKQDKLGQASLATVRVISGLVKSKNYNIRPEVLKTLLCLRIKEVEVKKDTEDLVPKQKLMSFKEKKKNLSRMQRKWKKAEEKLQKELLEADASESKEKKLKLHTETLNIVFLIYFRILKKAQKSNLLPSVLEGLAKFAHLINLEFFDDLLTVLHNLITSGDLSYRESLHCILTAFHILSGQGDVLNIDPLKFYVHLYKTLLTLHAGAANEDTAIALQCLDVMLTKRRKQITLHRALAFLKRLSMLSLHVMPDSCVGILATNRMLVHTFPKCDILLDNDMQGSGVYLPELDEPEYCNPQNTCLWELHTLKRHYHPMVRKYATHLLCGAPSEGSGALDMGLSRRTPGQLFEDYSVKDMTFNPPVAGPPSKKKEHLTIGQAFLDSALKKQVDTALLLEEDEVSLDFAASYAQE
ncbi:nucleolar complex protein 3 homolog isoform X1 [Electrophorus electricus]|uniref:nucleolar complex protein 3 homolog isoform X1 n=1 Tax=Electrophorus electricus TaxID=8005 RepID=UPI000F0A5FC9|nr:nucleolar complex protein 3 homolog isoform X1 [Electrophorus electricus]